jgi:hypothetical protein
MSKEFYPHVVLTIIGNSVTEFAFITGSSKKGYVYTTEFYRVNELIDVYYLYVRRAKLESSPDCNILRAESYHSRLFKEAASHIKNRGNFMVCRWDDLVYELGNVFKSCKDNAAASNFSEFLRWFNEHLLPYVQKHIGFLGYELRDEFHLTYQQVARCKVSPITQVEIAAELLYHSVLSTRLMKGTIKKSFRKVVTKKTWSIHMAYALNKLRAASADPSFDVNHLAAQRTDFLSLEQTVSLINHITRTSSVSRDRFPDFESNPSSRLIVGRSQYECFKNLVSSGYLLYNPGNGVLDMWLFSITGRDANFRLKTNIK